MTWLTVAEYLSVLQMTTNMFRLSTSQSDPFLIHDLIVTGFVTRVTRRVLHVVYTGADPGFQVREGALKKIAPRGGRRENIWGISCEKSRFYAKKSYFFQF